MARPRISERTLNTSDDRIAEHQRSNSNIAQICKFFCQYLALFLIESHRCLTPWHHDRFMGIFTLPCPRGLSNARAETARFRADWRAVEGRRTGVRLPSQTPRRRNTAVVRVDERNAPQAETQNPRTSGVCGCGRRVLMT